MNGSKVRVAKAEEDGGILSCISHYHKSDRLTDVTLSCPTAKLRCHQLVVASASPILATLLRSAKDEEPSIFFDAISESVLTSVVSLIYTGSACLDPADEEATMILTQSLGLNNVQVSLNTTVTNNNNFLDDPYSWLDAATSINWSIAESYIFGDDHLLESSSSTVDSSEILYSFSAPQSTPTCSESSEDASKAQHHLEEVSPITCAIMTCEPKKLAKKSSQCQICDKTFSGDYYLRQHQRRMHSTSRSFVCSSCPAAFGLRYDLVVHERTHEVIKPFACKFCPRTHCNARALREHMRTHTGERPFKCPHQSCGKAFALPKTLRVHFRQHSGERPYLCPHCGRTFVQNSTLKNHLRKHHQDKTHVRKKKASGEL